MCESVDVTHCVCFRMQLMEKLLGKEIEELEKKHAE